MHLPAAENFIPKTVIEGMSCPGIADALSACTRKDCCLVEAAFTLKLQNDLPE